MAGGKTQAQTQTQPELNYTEFAQKLESLRSDNGWVYVRLYENDTIVLELQLAPKANGSDRKANGGDRKGVLVIRGQKPSNKLVLSSGLMLEDLARLVRALENSDELRQKVKFAFEYLNVNAKKQVNKHNVYYI
jgi:hypothetical protein